MDASACRVVYIDDRFNTERWITREGFSTPVAPQRKVSEDLNGLPPDLQANVHAVLSVFSQVFVCSSGRSFSTKLSELRESVTLDCTPIIALFDVGSENRNDYHTRHRPRFATSAEPPTPSPHFLRRQITFSSESDECYGLQLLSRIASDLQVEDGVQLIIPVAIVQPKRKDSDSPSERSAPTSAVARGSESTISSTEDQSAIIDSHMMLDCLEAGALDVVQSPLDKAGILGLIVHAYRIYKAAKKEQAGFLAKARSRRKQSWVGVEEEEKPYAYMREAMVKKLLKAICEPETVIEDYQHRELHVDEDRKPIIAREVGSWSFCAHDFSEDELVYAGYCMLDHALQMPELTSWRMPKDQLLRFMQGCRVAYNSFVLYHNFRHAVDVLQSLFYFIVQIGTIPPYPKDSAPPPFSNDKSPIAKLLQPFDALTLLISAIGHDVGHPGVNNMFLVKLNAPLAQLYNDQSVLEAFHCAAYSQILRRHWPSAFDDKDLRKLMISSILATDMGVHPKYMKQLGHLQEKIHESKTTDGWSPKDLEEYRVLLCGLLIKCADISNVARPWAVAEKWTHLLQLEFANQGEMESAVGMETVLFGGPPEIGNVLKLAHSQIGFMTIFAHPLFNDVADIIPAMGFAPAEIITNKGVWAVKIDQEKRKEQLRCDSELGDDGAISPRSQSPSALHRNRLGHQHSGEEREATSYFPASPLRNVAEPPSSPERSNCSPDSNPLRLQTGFESTSTERQRPSQRPPLVTAIPGNAPVAGSGNSPTSRNSLGVFSGGKTDVKPQPPPLQTSRPSSNTVPTSQLQLTNRDPFTRSTALQGSGENETPRQVPSQQPDEMDDREEVVDASAPSTSFDSDASGLGGTSHQYQSSTSASAPSTLPNSRTSEAIRTARPSTYNQVAHSGDHPSVPSLSNANFDRTSMATSGATSASTTDIGTRATLGTLSPSTEATSVVSGEGDAGKGSGRIGDSLSWQEDKSDFEAQRARATSAPTRVPFFAHRGSRESSKYDVRTTVLGQENLNGDLTSKGGTMPRRRSRMRLAFWKRRSESEE